ncbi:hypothetical protein EXIGUO8H_20005 [Exiguobacterium sp. 8H]|nr:hypothetical protein EXIGUO8H_20005 [Exiguobacterium sp. 8H]
MVSFHIIIYRTSDLSLQLNISSR